MVFPEIISEPIPLGLPLEATVKIGDDESQLKRIIRATLLFPMFGADNIIPDRLIDKQKLIQELQALQTNPTKKILTAHPRSKSTEIADVVLEVIYPTPIGGFAMTPMPIFNWYGKEAIKITDITESQRAEELIKIKYYSNTGVIGIGLTGREIDGMEIFE